MYIHEGRKYLIEQFHVDNSIVFVVGRNSKLNPDKMQMSKDQHIYITVPTLISVAVAVAAAGAVAPLLEAAGIASVVAAGTAAAAGIAAAAEVAVFVVAAAAVVGQRIP